MSHTDWVLALVTHLCGSFHLGIHVFFADSGKQSLEQKVEMDDMKSVQMEWNEKNILETRSAMWYKFVNSGRVSDWIERKYVLLLHSPPSP